MMEFDEGEQHDECPACEETDLKYEVASDLGEGDDIIVHIQCRECGCKWGEVYNFSRGQLLKEDWITDVKL